ncbi:S-layer homology domain-containing protein [Peptoniphilus sp. oral taxon 386]|uniref:S-layer homology domain-containing protein n=1 Tax=Peptoniphilus sp. oral taxon 386 TaxID=652713 RepID=UPI00030639CE|nr:S-layer homology domain-containing protein [Peptoniphilus sp. oral taxon 386]
MKRAIKKSMYLMMALLMTLGIFTSGTNVFARITNLETLKLEGDILIGDETEHDKVFLLEKSEDDIEFTVALDVKPIKDKVEEIKNKHYMNVQGLKTYVSNLDYTTIVTLELPNQMDFDPTTTSAALEGVNGALTITDVQKEDKKVTVTIKLVGQDAIEDYQGIVTAINKLDDTIKVKLTGAKFNIDASPNTNYTVKGKIGGKLKANVEREDFAKARATNGNVYVPFNFEFKVEQSEAGKDFILTNDPNNKDIQFTLKFKKKVLESPLDEKTTLYGDILVGKETEHDKVYEVSTKEEKINFTGVVNILPIVNNFKEFEKLFTEDNFNIEEISISGLDHVMTGTFMLPNEMDFDPATVQATLEGANGKFEITNIKTEGRKVTITMKFVGQDKIKTYKDIMDLVNGIKEELKVTLSGVKFNSSAKANTNYTVVGTLKGYFKADAEFKLPEIRVATIRATDNSIESYVIQKLDFDYEAIQSDEGRDFIIKDAPKPQADVIQFTLKYLKDIESPYVKPPVVKVGTLLLSKSAEKNISTEIHIAYIKGYEDQTVRGNGNLTRAEAAAMVTRLAKMDLTDNTKADYQDLKENAWYNKYINAALKANMIDPDGNNIRPNDKITRAEFAKMVAAIDKSSNGLLTFADVKGHKYEKEINQISANKRIVGYEDGTFRPDNNLTRAEAAAMLNRLLNRVADQTAIAGHEQELVHFKDLSKTDWFYYEIIEASNTHELTRRNTKDEFDRVHEDWLKLLISNLK